MGIPAQYDSPPDYNAGLEFNYDVWSADTEISMVNVPWNNDYRDAVKFADRAALNAYIDGLEPAGISLDKLQYLRVNQPVRIPISSNRAGRFNYMRVRNPVLPVNGDIQRDWYYFITGIRHVNASVTEVTVQLDVWQSYIYDITFGRSFIDRGHIGIANENAFDNYGRDYLTVPEGLDLGAEYTTIDVDNVKVYTDPSSAGTTSERSGILLGTTIDLEAEWENYVDDGTGALFLSPATPVSPGSSMGGIPSGVSYWVWPSSVNGIDGRTIFNNFLENLKFYPWIAAGIVSITIIPDLTRYGILLSESGADHSAPKYLGYKVPDQEFTPARYTVRGSFRASMKAALPLRYRHLDKFLTAPYLQVYLTAFNGSSMTLRPEAIQYANIEIFERAMLHAGSQRITFTPFKYNALAGSPTEDLTFRGFGTVEDSGDDEGDYIDTFVMMSNLPTMSIPNNAGAAALAMQANSIRFSKQSAEWSQQRALQGNTTAYDQASSGIGASAAQTNIGVGADRAQTSLSNQFGQDQVLRNLGSGLINGVGGGAAAGALGGGPGGAVVGAIGGVGAGVGGALVGQIQANANQANANAQYGIRSSATVAAAQAGINNAGYVRDTNKSLADFAARGDYENQVAGINARVQDIMNTPPSTVGQVGGELLAYAYKQTRISVRYKRIDMAALVSIGEYWLRYGYAVRRFAVIPQSLQVMSKFTYWKLLETYVTEGKMPETFKQAIRGIMEKGVTVWNDPADIGVTDPGTNVPLSGIAI